MDSIRLLATARRRRGWSRQQLALRIPVDVAHLARWEAGTRPVPLAAVARLAVLLDAPELLAGACAACPVGQACGRAAPEEVA